VRLSPPHLQLASRMKHETCYGLHVCYDSALMNGIGVLMKRPVGASLCLSLCDDAPSIGQIMSPYQTLYLLAPWSWTAQNCEQKVLFFISQTKYFVIAAKIDEDKCLC
jgi:hypothetical protein